MADPCIATLPFGFQDPRAEDFGELAIRLLAKAEAEVDRRPRHARYMLIPSLLFYLLYAFGVGAILWTAGIELRPVPLAVATTLTFIFMAGLGVHYKDEADWRTVAEGAGRLHRRVLGYALAVKLLTAAFFIIPAMVMKNLTALFPRRPRLDQEVLALATNLIAALDEPVPVDGLAAVLPHETARSTVDAAILFLVWVGGVSVVQRSGQQTLLPGPKQDDLIGFLKKYDPHIIGFSVLTRDSSEPVETVSAAAAQRLRRQADGESPMAQRATEPAGLHEQVSRAPVHRPPQTRSAARRAPTPMDAPRYRTSRPMWIVPVVVAVFAVFVWQTWPRLRIETGLADAEIMVDGRLVEQEHKGKMVWPGTHEVTLTAEGYNQTSISVHTVWDQTLVVRPPTPRRLTILGPDADRAGKLWLDPVLGMRFRYIPGGTFEMGSPLHEPGRGGQEVEHSVTITRGFWMCETEVTQGQFVPLMSDSGWNPSKYRDCGEDCPVERATWLSAVDFANKLSAKAGFEQCYIVSGKRKRVPDVIFMGLDCTGYRLPTEAEWEHAARAGTVTPFSTGFVLTTDQARFNDDPPESLKGGVLPGKGTVAVRSFPPNQWGLHEMHGNVAEYCLDFKAPYPPGPATDPTGPGNGDSRIYRGGSHGNRAKSCRSAHRGGMVPNRGSSNIGFRLVRTAG